MSNEKRLNAKESLKFIRAKFPKDKIVGCNEYANYFVFALVGKDTKPDEDGHYFANGWKVNRFTGEVTHFYPPRDGFENFHNGKEVNLAKIE